MRSIFKQVEQSHNSESHIGGILDIHVVLKLHFDRFDLLCSCNHGTRAKSLILAVESDRALNQLIERLGPQNVVVRKGQAQIVTFQHLVLQIHIYHQICNFSHFITSKLIVGVSINKRCLKIVGRYH